MRFAIGIAASALLAASVYSRLIAQTFGEITGVVNNSSGAVLASATVAVTNVSSHQVRRVQTNETGNYTVPFLLPRLYDVEASSQGFKSVWRKGVDLQVGQIAGPFIERDHTFQWLDNVSMVRGKHSFKFAGEVRRGRFNQIGNQFERGQFVFQGQAIFDPARRTSTGHSFADLLLGETRQRAQALGSTSPMFRGTLFAVYGEGSWEITPLLQLPGRKLHAGVEACRRGRPITEPAAHDQPPENHLKIMRCHKHTDLECRGGGRSQVRDPQPPQQDCVPRGPQRGFRSPDGADLPKPDAVSYLKRTYRRPYVVPEVV